MNAPVTMRSATDVLLLVIALCCTGGNNASCQAPAVAELPRVYLDTRMPATTGRTLTVGPRDDLQAALDRARPGDEIVLQAGATYAGNFVLPTKAGASRMPGAGAVITVRSSALSALREGRRVGPADTVSMARLVTQVNGGDVIGTNPGTAGWRFSGLEITAAPNVARLGRLVRFGSGNRDQNTQASVPHNLVLDRSYVHVGPTLDIKRCIDLESAASAVIDSYLAGCHSNEGDAQAIAGWNGPGPYKIVNNYLEGSAENIQWGGADPALADAVPSDIEIRRNHFFKPLEWKGKWIVKNLYESKASRRSLIEGNVFENNWVHAQNGSAIALKSTNQSGRCTWCGTQDLTFRYNLIRNTGSGFNLSASPDPNVVVPMQRVTITDNVVVNIDVAPFNGDGRGFLINGNIADMTIAHNTILSPTNSAVTFGGPVRSPPIRLVIRDNIIGGGLYGVKGDGVGAGTATIAAFMRDGSFAGNVLVLPNASGYPGGNRIVSNWGSVGFTNINSLDLRLVDRSDYKKRGSDGRDPGADMDALNAAIAGVVVP
ncbi:MAG: hypothetical protein ABI664_01680 [bacterium]